METKTDSKKENSTKAKAKTDWKPLATEMGIVVLRGLITGFTMQAGIMIFDKSFGRKSNNLLLIEGGKKAVSA